MSDLCFQVTDTLKKVWMSLKNADTLVFGLCTHIFRSSRLPSLCFEKLTIITLHTFDSHFITPVFSIFHILHKGVKDPKWGQPVLTIHHRMW